MISSNKPKLVIPDDLFDSPNRDIKVAAVRRLVNKEPTRVAQVIKSMLNKDNNGRTKSN